MPNQTDHKAPPAKPKPGPDFRVFGKLNKLVVEEGAHDGSFPDFPPLQRQGARGRGHEK